MSLKGIEADFIDDDHVIHIFNCHKCGSTLAR